MADSVPFDGRDGALQHPPIRDTAHGKRRRVGIEIEFAEVPLEHVAAMVADLFGGEIRQDAPFAYRVTDTRLGDFAIELDSQYAQPGDGKGGLIGSALRDKLAAAVGHVTKVAVPSEITCPPVAYDDMTEIVALMDTLARAGAAGTDESVLYAFGLQFNPEIAAADAGAITKTLKAYMLLSDWLRAEIEVDALRALLPFAAPFPTAYRARLAAPGYTPDLARLIDDYLAENATRNRELDMLPLFAHLDPDRVRAAIDDPRIKPRPTYHYRLPNALFDRAGRHLLHEWNRWVVVERVAADQDLLDDMGKAFGAAVDHDFDAAAWAERCAGWVATCLRDR